MATDALKRVEDLHLVRLTKTYGDHNAVDDLSLTIPAGSFFALLGPSGCGKTTTMNMIAGLESPTAGEIYFDDKPMKEVVPGKRGVGFVFQNYAIFSHMTVAENIGFGLKIAGRSKADRQREVRKVADLVQLTPMLEMNAGRLSINDMQKVALGRSMITQPSIFLLDEPFSNLDAAFREYMRGELKRLQRSLKQTMVYVTHDQVEAMSMADKIAVMYCGELYQFGSPEDIYNQPVNMFVARIIGSPNMNFMNCNYLFEDGEGYLVQKAGGAKTLVDSKRRALVEKSAGADNLVLGVRPEHLSLSATPPAYTSDSGALWEGAVYAIEPLGPKTVIHLKVGGDALQVVAPSAYRPRVGEKQYLALDVARTHIFDGNSKAVIR
jgi:multiple sugar transport system ATP-binding protein